MQRICTTLAEAGHVVTLIGRELPHSKALTDCTFAQKRLKCFYKKGKLFYIEYNIRLFLYLLTQKTDVFGAVDLDTILPNLFVAKLKNKKLAYDAHEYFSELPEVVLRPFTKKVWESVAAFAIPKCDICYTVGENLARIFSERYQKTFGIVRNVPFLIENKIENTAGNGAILAQAKNTKKILLYQGALNDGRGLRELLYAMPMLRNAELWLVGEGDESASLRTLATHLQVHDCVRFLGYVLPHELKNITAQADIGINLLQNKGLNYYYSLANKFFDYIQADIPSVNPAFPEYQSILAAHEVGICVSNLDPNALAAAIQPLIDDIALYAALQMNCESAKLVYNWQKEAKNLLSHYHFSEI